jgi:hypothetical protein
MKGIFKQLLELGITYAVIVSFTKFKGNEASSREYFLVADKTHKKELQEFGFDDRKNHQKVVERDLTIEEQSMFRDLTSQDKFIKKVHTKSGRVYEVKGLSFKESLSK